MLSSHFGRILPVKLLIGLAVIATLDAQSGMEQLLHAERLIREGRHEEARRASHLAIESEPMAGGPRLARALNDLGAVCHDLGRVRDASWYYLESISLWERATEVDPVFAIVLTNLATIRLREGRLSEAERLFRRAIAVLEGGGKPDGPEIAVAFNGLAELLYYRKQRREAEDWIRRTLLIGVPGRENRVPGREKGIALFLLATIRRAEGDAAQAVVLLRQAVAAWEGSLGRRHPTTASGLACLANLLLKTAPDEAERLFVEALATFESELGRSHADTGGLLRDYATLLRRLGRKQEAKALERRSAEIAALHSNETAGRHSVDWTALRSRNTR